MNSQLFQQGDLLLLKVDEIPDGVVEISGHNGVLMEGEATGHKHQVQSPVQLFQSTDGNMFMDSPKRTILTHNTHKTLELLEGRYKILAVQEKDHLQDIVRTVVD